MGIVVTLAQKIDDLCMAKVAITLPVGKIRIKNHTVPISVYKIRGHNDSHTYDNIGG